MHFMHRLSGCASVLLKVLALATGGFWCLLWILNPVTQGKAWLTTIDHRVTSTFMGVKGSVFLLQAMPIIVLVFIAYLVVELEAPRSFKRIQVTRKPWLSIWTLPVFVRSPLGLLTVADLLLIATTLSVVFWYFIANCVKQFRLVDASAPEPGGIEKWAQKLAWAAVLLGKSALIPFALLWLPVSRGSQILRLVGISFERAVRYHTWLGFLTVLLLLAHGVSYVAFFVHINEPIVIIQWQTDGVAILPGVISLAAGLLMLITALSYVRRNYFNVFFTVHQLYFVFLAFFVFHAVMMVYYVAIPVLLFFVDRFMRFVQSRKSVDVISSQILPSGALEIKFAKPQSVRYSPLGFVMVRLPSISWLEWHPFSIASSPLDGTDEISIYIKPVGGFTKELHDALVSSKHATDSEAANNFRNRYRCPFSFRVSVEGPYGDDSRYFFKYKSLILVAGGIGITPYLSMLKDILHRHAMQRQKDESDLPTSVELIIMVRNAQELCILKTLDPREILPNYSDYVTIHIQAFVTSPCSPSDLSMNRRAHDLYTRLNSRGANAVMKFSAFETIYLNESPVQVFDSAMLEKIEEMSPVVGSGHSKWAAASVFSAIVGYIILWGVFHAYIINANPGTNVPNYSQALLYFTDLALAVVLFAGVVMLPWYIFCSSSKIPADGKPPLPALEMESARFDSCVDSKTLPDQDLESGNDESCGWRGKVTIGQRPVWEDLFAQLAQQHTGENVGVLVSGSESMQSDVAKECQRRSLSWKTNIVLHYHSVSFQL